MKSCDSILQALKEASQQGVSIAPADYLEYASELNALIGDENEKLYILEQTLALEKFKKIELGDSVAKAQSYIDTLDIAREAKTQKAKVEQIEEHVRILKRRSQTAQQEYAGYQ